MLHTAIPPRIHPKDSLRKTSGACRWELCVFKIEAGEYLAHVQRVGVLQPGAAWAASGICCSLSQTALTPSSFRSLACRLARSASMAAICTCWHSSTTFNLLPLTILTQGMPPHRQVLHQQLQARDACAGYLHCMHATIAAPQPLSA